MRKSIFRTGVLSVGLLSAGLSHLVFATLSLIVSASVSSASTAPGGYPIVKGVVKKIDLAQARVGLKHDEIPNLSMPGMTMSFPVKNVSELSALAVGDAVNFVADEVDGEATVLWIEKAAAAVLSKTLVFCAGLAPTSPPTKVEIDIRENKFSTIRYEITEGAYEGTALENSIGRLVLQKLNDSMIFQSGTGELDSKLILKVEGGKIQSAQFTNYSAGMKDAPVLCQFP